MLRIKSDAQLSLVMRRPERLFTPLFIRAFLIALAFHFFGLMTLKIEEKKLPTALWVYPFADIYTDPWLEDTHHEHAILEKFGTGAPPRSQPIMPKFHHRPHLPTMPPPMAPLSAMHAYNITPPLPPLPREKLLEETLPKKLHLPNPFVGQDFRLIAPVPLNKEEDSFPEIDYRRKEEAIR